MFRALPILLLAMLAMVARGGAAEAEIKRIAPFIDGGTVAVLRVDLTKFQIAEMLTRLIQDRDDVEAMSKSLVPWVSALRQAGAREFYVVVDPSDLPGPPIALVPLGENVDAKQIGKLLCGEGKEKPPLVWPTCATIHETVFAGTPEALDRVRQIKPAVRPELAEAFVAAGDRDVQVLLIPTPENRRVLEEMQPALPRELGGGPSTILTRGFLWGALGLETMPDPSVRMVIQSQDAASAKALEHLALDVLRWFEGLPWTHSRFPNFAKVSAQIKPTAEKDRVVLNLGIDQGKILVETIHRAWSEFHGRIQCVNNEKHLGLAIHNYHATHKSFPPAYSVDKQGRPLLSWRVLILPFLEQESLFQEFHLDEAWDSPHNRTLIEKMPAVYRCPSSSRKLSRAGKTTYLVPHGKATIFPGSEGTKIKDVTDGTSNTILTVDADDRLAVEWTKPQDWDVDSEADIKAIFGHHPEGTNFGFADGSVRFLKETIKAKTLQLLLTRNGGEVYNPNEE